MKFIRPGWPQSFGWIPFTIGVLAWLGAAAWQIGPYSARLQGFDSANPNLAPLVGFACPVTVTDSGYTLHAYVPEPHAPSIVYLSNFSIIPADVSMGFQPLCGPPAVGVPPYPADAMCHFDVPNLLSKDSSAWFIRATAVEQVPEGVTSLNGPYGGVCFIRREAAFWRDMIVAGLAELTGLALVFIAAAMWPGGSWGNRIAAVLAIPLIWYVTSMAASLVAEGSLEWFFFAGTAVLIAAIITLRIARTSKSQPEPEHAA